MLLSTTAEYRGHWTTRTKRIFPDSQYILVEPLEEMSESLESLVEPGTEYVAASLGAKNSTADLTITDDLARSTLLSSHEGFESRDVRRVPVVTLDSLLGARPNFSPDLLKMDIQGFELEALRGATTSLEQVELVVVETALYEFWRGQPLLSEIVGFMADHGFQVYDIAEYLRRPFDGALGQLDVWFAAVGGFLRQSRVWH